MRQFREQLTRVGKIVDLMRGWRQIGRFACHHQQVHGLNDSRLGTLPTTLHAI
jgi:hypothetical protein